MTCSRRPQPLGHLPATPHSDTAHSCLRAPQTPPGPERGSLWATRSLGEAAGPSQLRPGREGGRRGREEHRGRRVRSLWQVGQKQRPAEGRGQRAGGHGFFQQCTEPSWGREAAWPRPDSCVITQGCTRPPVGVPVLTPTPGPGRPEPSPGPSGCHRQSVAREEEQPFFWPERRIKG